MKRGLFLLLCLIFSMSTFGQTPPPSCCAVLPPDTSQSSGNPEHHCFDVDSIIDNCITVYLNVNIHFFLPDDCDGDIGTADSQGGDLSKENAFALAENMINEANDFLNEIGDNALWGVEYHGGTPDTTACIPIQLVLNGVQVHCDTDAQSTGVSFSDFVGYRHNINSELNIFVSDVLPRPWDDPNGFAAPRGKEMVIENFTPWLIIHELGHLLDLAHNFEDEQDCDDIWGENSDYSYDYNCDGQIDETGHCWSVHNDVNINGETVNACDTTHPDICAKHPCCYWHNQNNNIMSYNAYATGKSSGAFSPCQLRIMMEHLSTAKCDYIESIGGACPPPKANIGLLPPEYGMGECPTCFYLSATVNEDLYDIDILDDQGNALKQTGHLYQEATTYCIEPKLDKFDNPYWPNGLVAGDTLTLRLTVQNSCGDMDVEEVTFVLPSPCSPLEPNISILGNIVLDSLAPNPGDQFVQLYINSEISTTVSIFGIHSATGTTYGAASNFPLSDSDGQIVTLDVSAWLQGVHTIVVTDGQEVDLENFLKL